MSRLNQFASTALGYALVGYSYAKTGAQAAKDAVVGFVKPKPAMPPTEVVRVDASGKPILQPDQVKKGSAAPVVKAQPAQVQAKPEEPKAAAVVPSQASAKLPTANSAQPVEAEMLSLAETAKFDAIFTGFQNRRPGS